MCVCGPLFALVLVICVLCWLFFFAICCCAFFGWRPLAFPCLSFNFYFRCPFEDAFVVGFSVPAFFSKAQSNLIFPTDSLVLYLSRQSSEMPLSLISQKFLFPTLKSPANIKHSSLFSQNFIPLWAVGKCKKVATK